MTSQQRSNFSRNQDDLNGAEEPPHDDEHTSLLRNRLDEMLTATTEVAESEQRRRNSKMMALRKLKEAKEIMAARRAAQERGESFQDLEGHAVHPPRLRSHRAIVCQALSRPSTMCVVVSALLVVLLYYAASGRTSAGPAAGGSVPALNLTPGEWQHECQLRGFH